MEGFVLIIILKVSSNQKQANKENYFLLIECLLYIITYILTFY
jgi:hypothetical protein